MCGEGVPPLCDNANVEYDKVECVGCVWNATLLYVTSAPTSGAMSPDEFCEAFAPEVLMGFGEIRAFISDGDTQPADWLMAMDRLDKPVARATDGVLLGESFAALKDGLKVAILDEAGDVMTNNVWSNTRGDGGVVDAEGGHCDGWSSDQGMQTGEIGVGGKVDASWADANTSWPCGTENHVYCAVLYPLQ